LSHHHAPFFFCAIKEEKKVAATKIHNLRSTNIQEKRKWLSYPLWS